jgi:hypothetical protein
MAKHHSLPKMSENLRKLVRWNVMIPELWDDAALTVFGERFSKTVRL